MFDTAIIGGGIMGCASALELAEAGMSVALLERRFLASSASGVNAGTLSLTDVRAALVPYALRSVELWRTLSERLGFDIHYREIGSITVAFNDREAEVLRERIAAKAALGIAVDIINAKRAREIAPALCEDVKLAAYCAEGGYANSAATGRAYRLGLIRAGVTLHEQAEVTRIERNGDGFVVSTANGVSLNARRIVLAGGSWLGGLGKMLGIDFPVHWRVSQVSVTERMKPSVSHVVSHAYGLLTLKQSDNGTILIGGGWQGKGDPERGPAEVLPQNLIGNLRLALQTIPALQGTRIVRTWLGLQAHTPDAMPLVGPIPGVENAFILGGVRTGYTCGPYVGKLFADILLGKEPELPLFHAPFNPSRFTAPSGNERLALTA